MKFCYFFLVLAVAASNCQVVDINWLVDLGLFSTNEFIRQHKFSTALLPEGSFGSNIKFSESVVIGLDSAKRTDNCTANIEGKNATIDLHFGLGLFQRTFSELKIYGIPMSASYRIRDNSLHMAYTIHNTTRCFVTLDDLRFQRLAKVDFFSSRPEFDGKEVDKFFETDVLPFLNKSINKAEVEKGLQAICKQQTMNISEHLPLVYMTVMRHVKEKEGKQ